MAQIIVPDVATTAAVLNNNVDLNSPVQVNAEAAPAQTKVRNPVTRIYSMHRHVIYEFKFPKLRPEGRERTAVDYVTALERIRALHKGNKLLDGSKPKDELEYDRWLLENTVKAIAMCATNIGEPFRSKNVDAFLKAMDVRMVTNTRK